MHLTSEDFYFINLLANGEKRQEEKEGIFINLSPVFANLFLFHQFLLPTASIKTIKSLGENLCHLIFWIAITGPGPSP